MPTQTPAFDLMLSRVIKAIESSGNAHALRFEPAQYAAIKMQLTDKALLATIAKRNYCSTPTAEVLACTSFGAYQIMGSNLYSLGWNNDVANFLTDPASQDLLFGEFLDVHSINDTLADLLSDPEKLSKFAKVYNGSLAYGVSIRTAATSIMRATM